MEGRYHILASIILSPLSVGVAFVATGNVSTSLLVGVGCAASALISPDLDQENITASEWGVIRPLGPFGGIGLCWAALWWAYAWLVPHRSFWSHFPIVGTLGRALYLGAHIVVGMLILGYRPVFAPAVIIPIIGGLAVGDTVHALMDVGNKPKRKRR